MFSLYSAESHEKTLQPLEAIAKMTMKPKALAQMKPSQVLEAIVVKDEELLSDIALHLEKSNILTACKSNHLHEMILSDFFNQNLRIL